MALLPRIEWVAYVPAYAGWRARYQAGELIDDDAAPVERRVPWMELRRPTAGDVRALLPLLGRAGDGTTAVGDRVFSREWFVRHIRGIHGLALEDGTAITSGEDLWRIGVEQELVDQALVLELLTAILELGTLEAGLKKSLRSGRGLSGSAMRSDGTVSAAAPAASTSPATVTAPLTAGSPSFIPNSLGS
jgi:hypothetical protein